MFLLDAGVWVASKDPDDRFFETARPIVVDPDQPVAALDLTLYEVANAIGARRRDLDVAQRLCRTIAARCGDRIVPIDADAMQSVLEIAIDQGLTAYDAAYVAVARANGWTLVSTDVADLVSKGLAVTPDAADYP
jgi:predicted nucleic acid-binding protein